SKEASAPASDISSPSNTPLAPGQIGEKISEAKQLLGSRSTNPASVAMAALDPQTSQISIFSVPKDSFLITGSDLNATTQLGNSVVMHIINANGVNTSVSVKDTASGRQLIPLVVQYPIVKDGVFTETAYYTSAHPALMSTDVTKAGNAYVTSMLETAAQR